MNDSFYRAYEDRHRGSRELIKSRLRAYTPFLQPLASVHRPASALDLGCGRGEWLELLGESGFDAGGVDMDEGMLVACRERGLNAQRADAIQTLRELPDNSLALVSAFHVVEHLAFEDVRLLAREILRVLQPGGLLIFETPNPENLMVGASEFYKDPSHLRPVPWELLQFVVEHAGFQRNAILRLQESARLRGNAPVRLIHVLGGASPDYAVVAQKNGDVAVLSAFDAAFGMQYGLSVESLAQRYDAQAEQRLAESKRQWEQSETRAAHLEAQLQHMQAHVAQLETRFTHLEAHVHAVYQSNSWRVTAPLRLVAGTLYRVRTAMRAHPLVIGGKRGVKTLLRRFGQAVQRQPLLRKTVLKVLDTVPGVRHRLYKVMFVPEARPDLSQTEREARHLAPRAMRIYTELSKMIEQEKS